jgi:DNA sulfur modification protein DndD
MYIERLEFHNWKVYRDVTFDFIAPSRDRNIVLIGAMNGGGKTSFLEGLFFCLYGLDALDLINRRGDDLSRGQKGYRDFLTRSLNNIAKSEHESVSRIRMTITGDKYRRVVERTWHFDVHGNFSEEELNIYEGDSCDPIDVVSPLHVPALVTSKDEYLRNYISLNILMPTLAPFFIFDGEQIQKLAQQEHTEQVKEGLNKLLGLDLLENLMQDLTSISAEKRKNSRNIASSSDLIKLDQEFSEVSTRLNTIDREVKKNQIQLTSLEREANDITNRLIGMYGEKPEVSKVIAEQAEIREKLSTLTESLGRTLLSKTLPLALPHRLRKQVVVTLQNESKVRSMLTTQQHGQLQVDKFIDEFFTNRPDINSQVDSIKLEITEKLRSAWSVVFSTEHHVADGPRNLEFLSLDDIRTIGNRLHEVSQLTFETILERISSKERLEQRLQELDRMAKALSEESQAKEMVEQSKALQVEHTELKHKQKTLIEEAELLRPRLANLKSKRTEAENQLGKTNYDLKCAALADKAINASEEFIQVMQAKRGEQLGSLMTEKYLELAHKGVVSKIHIDAESKVHLLRHDGSDVRDGDLSAGENQVFALSLVGASSAMSRAKVPVVIDTPLARLDVAHRTNIVERYLPSASEQVIVLSTDTEVVGELAASIEDNILQTFLVKFDNVLGSSSVESGYFEDQVRTK